MRHEVEKQLIAAIERAAEQLDVDPGLLGRDLDQALMKRLEARGYGAAAEVPGPLVNPVLEAAWFEAVSLHGPSLSDADVWALVNEVLDQLGQAIRPNVTLN